MRGKYAPVWHAAANLKLLEMAKKGLYESRTTHHSELMSTKNSGTMVSEANTTYLVSSDENCDGHVRERSPPWLNEGNTPQYGIRCIGSVLITRE
uniref:Uncharacterized protein n=1 Tax=Vitis vinifera TaxID=29760 RepID=A5B409_VITVI|nr:hypothetical protein VITISV_039845 [Vitis vinifera]